MFQQLFSKKKLISENSLNFNKNVKNVILKKINEIKK